MLRLLLNITIPQFFASSGSCIIVGIHDSNCLVATIDQRSPTCIEFTAHAPASQTEHMVSLGNMTVHDPHLCVTPFSSLLSSVAVCAAKCFKYEHALFEIFMAMQVLQLQRHAGCFLVISLPNVEARVG